MTIEEILTPLVKEQWGTTANTVLADALRDLLAGWMESEFLREHRDIETSYSKPGSRHWMCSTGCGYRNPCHYYQWADWQGCAGKILEAK